MLSSLINQLRQQGERLTAPRRAVLEMLTSVPGHHTVEEIRTYLAEHDHRIDQATVYRVLQWLKELGVVSQSDLGLGRTVYELVGTTPHHHLICLACGAITNLSDELIEPLREALHRDYGFEPRIDHMVFFGLCPSCQARQNERQQLAVEDIARGHVPAARGKTLQTEEGQPYLLVDPMMGMAGDMFAAALLALGAPQAGMLQAMEGAAALLGQATIGAQLRRMGDEHLAFRLEITLQPSHPALLASEARQLLPQALSAAGVESVYANFAIRALEILIAAEREAHRAGFPPPMPEREPLMVTPIGIAHTPYQHEAPYQPVTHQPFPADAFYIEVDPTYADGLADLETFSHIFVLSYLDRSQGYQLQVTPPWMEDEERQAHGLFATRAPDRPSPIGLTRTRLVYIEGNRVYTGPLDLFDGTPVLDIKPVVRSLDEETSDDGWLTGSDHLALHRAGVPHRHTNDVPALHEAQDILIDLVGAAWGLQALGVDLTRVVCLSPVQVGGGWVDSSHGRLPVPAPATAAILRRYAIPFAPGPVEAELLTPTGAAILAALRPTFQPRGQVELVLHQVGFGLGKRQFDRPNALRLGLG
ncbi:MAG TPA: tRNA (N6-threonylcarbamoyladenosine(37)-N6)-methyltransferase TrmO [Anaerolineae bacterium]|nr:tRNA (N6-threonylcarbamoyladenosine(37)-N6)-methyltransferase TrmO [Anaerolineae bacterium]HIQ05321.1 tRNA (N6-threonylcarbamoyladenosine(37)-N6)-methyltransferase TrmO [Anaerolineae bacterium]